MKFLLFAANIDDPAYREKMLAFIFIMAALMMVSFIICVVLPKKVQK